MANTIDLKTLTADEALYLRAKAAYYDGNPIMDDAEFDIIEETLVKIDSFVVEIIGSVKVKGDKATISKGKTAVVQHVTPMGSLKKIQFKPDYIPFLEFQAWLNQLSSALVEFTPKLDGNAINCIYVDGELKHILSRGDGYEGQDYTASFAQNVPSFIKGFTGEIRGEAVIDTYLFDTVYGPNSNAVKKYANARNFVAGALTKGDKTVCADIDFVAFQIANFKENTQDQLIKWGFNTLDFIKHYNASELDLKTFEKMYAEFKYYRENCKYQLDGIVAKMPESDRSYLGGSDKYPNWGLAIKFITQAVYTRIIGIDWTLGKRGQLAPVALLEAVDLLGTEVKRASVYNADWMLKNKCYPGAQVSLIKSGDIIPKIVEVTEPSNETYDLMTEWNGHAVVFDGVQLMVADFESTPEFAALKLYNSISALGIKNVGPALSERIAKAGLGLQELMSQNPLGLEMLLIQSGEFKQGRELQVLIEDLFAFTQVDLWQVIYAMGYRNCGKTISKQLANWMTNIPYDFKGLEKQVIMDFIQNKDVQDEVQALIDVLRANNVNVIEPVQPKAGLITFEMSGDCSTHSSKGQFKLEIESSGKALHTSLGKETQYLVTASLASMTTKMQKAMKNGTQVVTYEDFINIIANA